MSWYLDEQTFSGSLLISGVALLNWFTKSSRFEEGFNDNELLWSFPKPIHWMVLLSVFVATTSHFLFLESWTKYLAQSKEIQENWARLKRFVI